MWLRLTGNRSELATFQTGPELCPPWAGFYLDYGVVKDLAACSGDGRRLEWLVVVWPRPTG